MINSNNDESDMKINVYGSSYNCRESRVFSCLKEKHTSYSKKKKKRKKGHLVETVVICRQVYIHTALGKSEKKRVLVSSTTE